MSEIAIVKQFIDNKDSIIGQNFLLINKFGNPIDSIIINYYYIIHLKERNLFLFSTCTEKAILNSSFRIFATYKDNIFDSLKEVYTLKYNHTEHYDGIEYQKFNKYEKCDIYFYSLPK